MNRLLNVMRDQAAMQAGDRATTRVGTISSYDPGAYAVKVMLQPDNTETNWLPLLSPWIGNGWGLFAPPSIGDMVEVQFHDADFDAGLACLRFFSDINRPLSVQSGEFWLVHQSGAFFKLTNDGKALINGQVEIDATAPAIKITATGNVDVQAGGVATIKAPSIILKNAGAALKKLCTSVFMDLFNSHTHLVTAVGAQTNTPTQQASAGTHTTNIVQAE